MIRNIRLIIITLAAISFASCTKEFDKYERPAWLAGKLYTQIKSVEGLGNFAKCLEKTGYDTLINRSGSFTVFAPSDAAFDLYFQQHPGLSSVDDIPMSDLIRIVKYHIVQNPWSLDQLKSLDVYGWIDS